MSTCLSYKVEWWHFLIPSVYEFKKLCDSYDKTTMFLVSITRFIFYALIFRFFHMNKIIIYDEFENLRYFLFMLSITIVIMSFFSLILVISKRQINPQNQKMIELERQPQPRKQVIPIQIFGTNDSFGAEKAISGLV